MTIDLTEVAKQQLELQEEREKAREERRGGGKNRINWLKLKPGSTTKLRILPIFPPDLKLGAALNHLEEGSFPWVCRLQAYIGPNRRRIIPPSQFDENALDPYQDYLDELRADTTEKGKKKFQEEKPSLKFFAFVVVRSVTTGKTTSTTNEQGDSYEAVGPQIFAFGTKIKNQIVSLMANGGGSLVDPEQGRDILITRAVKNSPDMYSVNPDFNVSKAGDEAWWSENLFEKLSYYWEPTEPEFIVAAVEGADKEYIAQKQAEREAQYEKKRAEKAEQEAVEAPSVDESATQAAPSSAVERMKARLKAKKNKPTEVPDDVDDLVN